MNLIYQHDLVQISHDQENKLLYISWQNYLTTEDFVRGLRALLQLTSDLEIEKWLMDARLSDELELGNLRWSKEYAGSALKQSKLKKIARIVSTNSENEKAIMKLADYLVGNFNLPCQIRFYKTEQEALNWLFERNEPEPLKSNKINLE